MIALLLGVLLSGTVSLRSEAQVAGPTVELAEIADVSGADAETTRRLSELSLGPSPAAGNVRGLRREDVVNALRGAGFAVATTGSALCRVKTRYETVPARDVEESARRAIATVFAGRDVEVELVRPAADLPVPAAERQRELRVDLGRREPQPGAWSVPVDVHVDGTRVHTAWVAIDVKVYEAQPVAVRDLRRGEPVDASSWKLERSRVEASGPRAATPPGLLGATCTRDLAAGTRISEVDVRRDPLVRSGDQVELEVVRGPIRARSRAVARGQGALGDRVEVQSGDGQRRLVGIVVERGLVRVELAAARRNER